MSQGTDLRANMCRPACRDERRAALPRARAPEQRGPAGLGAGARAAPRRSARACCMEARARPEHGCAASPARGEPQGAPGARESRGARPQQRRRHVRRAQAGRRGQRDQQRVALARAQAQPELLQRDRRALGRAGRAAARACRPRGRLGRRRRQPLLLLLLMGNRVRVGPVLLLATDELLTLRCPRGPRLPRLRPRARPLQRTRRGGQPAPAFTTTATAGLRFGGAP